KPFFAVFVPVAANLLLLEQNYGAFLLQCSVSLPERQFFIFRPLDEGLGYAVLHFTTLFFKSKFSKINIYSMVIFYKAKNDCGFSLQQIVKKCG
ncbi:MAG: hypothetical protein WAX69_12455, partial [Victivallales bacterium]